jgi:hypothetical protein
MQLLRTKAAASRERSSRLLSGYHKNNRKDNSKTHAKGNKGGMEKAEIQSKSIINISQNDIFCLATAEFMFYETFIAILIVSSQLCWLFFLARKNLSREVHPSSAHLINPKYVHY